MLDTNININMASVKVLGIPLISILVTIILLVASINLLGPKVPAKLAEIRLTQSSIRNLNNRIDVLKSFDSDVVSDKSDITYLVLPDANPASIAIAQIKKIISADDQGTLTNIEFSGSIPSIEGVDSTEISFSFASDSVGKITSVLRAFQKTAPIIKVSKVTITRKAGVAEADVTATTYWSALPEALPDLSQPISGLTNDERAVMDNILGFDLPNFSLNSPNAPAIDRTNPFN